jgi:hypothetical protein
MLVFSDGSKGGTGKSMVCGLLLDHFLEAGSDPVLIETDTSNPDVFKAYKDSCNAFPCQTDDENGWAAFINYIDEYRDSTIIVNCGARNQESIATWGETISQIGIEHKTFWVINTEKDSTLLLKQYIQTVPAETVTVVKNGFYGKDSEFLEYQNSKTREHIESEIFIPKLLKRAVSEFYSARMPFHKIADALPLGERLIYNGWLKTARETISGAL